MRTSHPATCPPGQQGWDQHSALKRSRVARGAPGGPPHFRGRAVSPGLPHLSAGSAGGQPPCWGSQW